MTKKFYTVGEMAELSGVSVKTLYHYQKIGILSPHRTGPNNYRYYSDLEINRLQEILIYRNMGFKLETIKTLFDAHSTDSRVDILNNQLAYAQKEVQHYEHIIDLLHRSIEDELKGHTVMEKKEKFENLEKYDDSIPRTLTNLTVIMSKPYLILFMLFGIMMIYFNGAYLINGDYIWGPPFESILINVLFILLGIVTVFTSAKIVFFTKTKDMLRDVNEPYRKTK
ncbi:hypothetical protein AOC36_11410 [Erysipelothrix larvae]|uniref:HTH merR-type domain-containing protein n=1 Tax=Erysipelothrix larvae TaxID=1514105 RepID=A0A0X8H1X6_9FIRM|nr:MerR family transcriptional regulator [Erysipelothrix larvae]AMC94556.1 hypothetical protein AOC36_11410 [Erysipelothrix larvae]